MKTLLFYHAVITAVSRGSEDAVTLADVKATRAAISEGVDGSVMLRDASVFSGEVEPEVDKVLFLEVDGLEFDDEGDESSNTLERILRDYTAVRQAYEAVEVEIAPVGLHSQENEDSSEDDEELAAQLRFAELKAEATALGLSFASNISETVLRNRVDQAKADKAKDEKDAAEKKD